MKYHLKIGKKKVLAVLLLFLSLPILHDSIRYHYTIGDIVISKLMFPFIKFETHWSEQFSEKQFQKIDTGISKSDVESLLGSPLYSECDQSTCFWQYTLPGNDTSSYHRRIVFFDSNGKVTNTLSELFYD